VSNSPVRSRDVVAPHSVRPIDWPPAVCDSPRRRPRGGPAAGRARAPVGRVPAVLYLLSGRDAERVVQRLPRRRPRHAGLHAGHRLPVAGEGLRPHEQPRRGRTRRRRALRDRRRRDLGGRRVGPSLPPPAGRDGTSFAAEYAAQPLVVDGRIVGSIVALSDLTQRRSTEAEIGRLLDAERAARADAEAANRAKDEFLAVLSHELRTPLTAMLGWIALLRPGRLPADRTRYALDVIERNTRMQAQLINDLLDVSRIVAGKMEFDRSSVDLAGVVLRVVE